MRTPRPPTSRPTSRPSGPRWERLKANVRARGERCCRCSQVIDYTLAYPDPNSFSVDHYPFPISTHPWLAWDPGNLHAAHLDCNQAARAVRPEPGLGQASEAW